MTSPKGQRFRVTLLSISAAMAQRLMDHRLAGRLTAVCRSGPSVGGTIVSMKMCHLSPEAQTETDRLIRERPVPKQSRTGAIVIFRLTHRSGEDNIVLGLCLAR